MHDDNTTGDTTGDTTGAAFEVRRESRHDGWTLERQVDFLEALAATGNVPRAAAVVGMSASGAYRARGRAGNEVFAFGWQAAQGMAYDRLREIAIDRIEHGVATPSTHKGEVVATKTVFSDRLLIAMLNHLKPATAAAPARSNAPPVTHARSDFAAAIAAFETAIATGEPPVLPTVNTPGVASPAEVRAALIAALDARLTVIAAEDDDLAVNFA